MSVLTIATWPFRATHRAVHAVFAVLGHGLALIPALAVTGLIAQGNGGDPGTFLVTGILFFFANRFFAFLAKKTRPAPVLTGSKAVQMPKATKEAPPVWASVAVGRHSAPSLTAIRRRLSPELRQLLS